MLGSALGRQHTTRGFEGERQSAQLIGITPALSGHLPILFSSCSLTCAQISLPGPPLLPQPSFFCPGTSQTFFSRSSL